MGLTRVLHFSIGRCNPVSANGVDQAVYHLSRTQAELGHEVAVFALSRKQPIPIPGVEVRCFAPSRGPGAIGRQLLRAVRAWGPQLVHLHSVFAPPNAALAWRLRRARIPYAVTPHVSFSRESLRRRWYLKLPYKWLVELPTLNGAAFVHAVAAPERVRDFGVRSPVVVAPNGIDLTLIPARRRAELLGLRHPQTRGRRVFLFVGRLDTLVKGLDLLLRGLALAAAPEAVLVLVGPDPRGQRRRLDALARRLGVASRVVFAGPEYGEAKYDLLAGADVFVLCSRTEGLPLAVLEAAACARPCLVSEAADPAGLVGGYEAGIVVQPTARGIGTGLRELALAPGPRLGRMGRNARRMVEREFSWRKTALLLGAAYEKYAGSREDRRP